jgi:nitrous oxide reductase accessory protein NosL
VRRSRLLLFLLLLALLTACGGGQAEIEPPAIRYGETECTECRMIISDLRFAAGYTYKAQGGRYDSLPFDDIGDMLIHAGKYAEREIVAYWVHDYYSEEWIDAEQASFVFSQSLVTPMAQGTAAVASRDKAEQLAAEYPGEVLDWAGLLAKHQAGELTLSVMEGMGMDAHHDAQHDHHGELITLGEADVEGYHLRLLSHGALHTGYNHLMVDLTDPRGQTVTQADIDYQPLMRMPEMAHATPVEQPGVQAHPDGLFAGAVGFVMPSGPDLGDWEIGVAFHDPAGGVDGQASFPVEVVKSGLAGSFVATDDESKIFTMVVSPQEAGIGLQPIEILVAQRASAMAWPPVDGLTLEIVPEMPTMDHGSPDNVNPVGIGNGRYEGQVNFTMAGPWTVTVNASRGGAEIGTVVFEFQVK